MWSARIFSNTLPIASVPRAGKISCAVHGIVPLWSLVPRFNQVCYGLAAIAIAIAAVAVTVLAAPA